MNLKEAFAEISEYLHIDLDEIWQIYSKISEKYEGYTKWTNVTEKEFNELKLDVKNPDQLKHFYSNTDNYIFELMEYHSTEVKARMRRRCIEIMKNHNIKSVLDYGCGIGQDIIEAAKEGIRAIACDIPGKTFDFAKWRFKKKNLNIECIDINSEEPLTDFYQAITCFEVVMLSPDPIKIIHHLYNHLDKNGLLFFTGRFKNNYNLVPKYNEKFEGKFDEIIQKIGFNRLYKEHMWGPTNEEGKYLYVYQKI